MRKEGDGNFYFNVSEKSKTIIGNFIEISIDKFNYDKFEQWMVQRV